MKKTRKDIARASVGLGTAALLGLAAPACTEAEKKPTTETPQPSETAPQQQGVEESAPAPQADAQQAAPAPQEPQQADAGQVQFPPPDASKPFYLRDGYKSPTRYAVLDPESIVNA